MKGAEQESELRHQYSGNSGDSRETASQNDSGAAYNEHDAENEEMINLYTCDFVEFSNHMAIQYGKEPFSKGFEIISKYKELIYTEEGEEELVAMLKHLFKT